GAADEGAIRRRGRAALGAPALGGRKGRFLGIKGCHAMMIEDFWVMLTASLVAASCGFIGCFLILRRMAMIGDAISHSVLLGIVLAFLLTGSLSALPMFIGAAVMGVVTTFIIQLIHQGGAQEDAAIGVTFTGLFALG